MRTEIERLQTQARELEKKANESDNSTSKEAYLNLLNSVKKDLVDERRDSVE